MRSALTVANSRVYTVFSCCHIINDNKLYDVLFVQLYGSLTIVNHKGMDFAQPELSTRLFWK